MNTNKMNMNKMKKCLIAIVLAFTATFARGYDFSKDVMGVGGGDDCYVHETVSGVWQSDVNHDDRNVDWISSDGSVKVSGNSMTILRDLDSIGFKGDFHGGTLGCYVYDGTQMTRDQVLAEIGKTGVTLEKDKNVGFYFDMGHGVVLTNYRFVRSGGNEYLVFSFDGRSSGVGNMPYFGYVFDLDSMVISGTSSEDVLCGAPLPSWTFSVAVAFLVWMFMWTRRRDRSGTAKAETCQA